MKSLIVLLFLSISLAACTSVQMTPEERERARERRAEFQVIRLRTERN